MTFLCENVLLRSQTRKQAGFMNFLVLSPHNYTALNVQSNIDRRLKSIILDYSKSMESYKINTFILNVPAVLYNITSSMQRTLLMNAHNLKHSLFSKLSCITRYSPHTVSQHVYPFTQINAVSN